MSNGVIVETNWIVDVAIERDQGSLDIWQVVQANKTKLFIPSICLAESVKVLEAWHRDWRALAEQLRRDANDFRRSKALALTADDFDTTKLSIDKLIDRVEGLFWPTIQQISQRARLLEMSSDTLILASDIREFLKLSPADATVLATVVLAKKRNLCHQFMSRDKKAFARSDTETYLQEQGIVYYESPFDYLQAQGHSPSEKEQD